MTNINTQPGQNEDQRTVITGMGVVSPLGIGKDAFAKSLREGRAGIGPVTLFETEGMRSRLASEITDFKPDEILGPKGLRNMDRTALLALSAAKMCLDDASYQIGGENADEVGVVLGSTMGSVWSISEFDKEGIRNGPKSVNPAHFPNTVMNAPASQISIRFGVRGFNTTIASGFTSSLDALIYARNFLRLGRAKAVLVGGVEELCQQTFKGLYKLGFLSGSNSSAQGEELCAPFDRRRNGVVLGEGSSIFLIERLSDARRRGATIYAEIGGADSAHDGKSYYRYNTAGEGARRAVQRALKESRLTADRITYISSSANSTLDGDLAEVRAVHNLFAKQVMVNAVKSMVGETLSAGGAFQIAAAVLGMRESLVYPTINFKEADRRCREIDCVPNEARAVGVENVLVTSLSPMGQNAAAVLSKAEI